MVYIKFLRIILLIFCIATFNIGYVYNEVAEKVEKSENYVKSCCNDTSNSGHRVKVEFTSKVVQNEYIVAFNNYYKSAARENYLIAALNNSGVSNLTSAKYLNICYLDKTKTMCHFFQVHIFLYNFSQNRLCSVSLEYDRKNYI